MARGWESKSVEQQQAEATTPSSKPAARLTHEQMKTQRQKQGLLLSRQRVLQQLASARNPHHRKMLEKALADLDAQLAQLG
ncbi:MAG TPA: hypothetical protein VMB18_05360 [Terriglobales bacterium]|nr:hypothetical protein [Terriglobales bacterium]